MTSPTVRPEQAVESLFAERQKYEGWIAGLELKRALTPTHIYERVHADYTSRLQRVVEQLHSHRASLMDMAAALTDRLTEMDIEEAKQRDERAEADLRAAVGEYTAEQVTQAQRKCDEVIASLGAQRQPIEAELAKLRTILDAAPPTPSTPQQAVPQPPARSAAPAPATPPSVEQFDDLQFLKAVVESPSGEHDAVPSVVGGRPSTPVGSEVVQGLAHGTSAMSSERMSGATFTDPVLTPQRVPEVRQTPSESRGGSFLRDVPPEQVKSLKCQECGTLNYPTEWYCERCGAELAAL